MAEISLLRSDTSLDIQPRDGLHTPLSTSSTDPLNEIDSAVKDIVRYLLSTHPQLKAWILSNNWWFPPDSNTSCSPNDTFDTMVKPVHIPKKTKETSGKAAAGAKPPPKTPPKSPASSVGDKRVAKGTPPTTPDHPNAWYTYNRPNTNELAPVNLEGKLDLAFNAGTGFPTLAEAHAGTLPHGKDSSNDGELQKTTHDGGTPDAFPEPQVQDAIAAPPTQTDQTEGTLASSVTTVQETGTTISPSKDNQTTDTPEEPVLEKKDGGKLEHFDIHDEVMDEEYTFGLDDNDNSWELLMGLHLNYKQICQKLRERAASYKQPHRSAPHASKGPFTLLHSEQKGSIDINNSKGQLALRTDVGSIKLNTGDLTFASDSFTYFSLHQIEDLPSYVQRLQATHDLRGELLRIMRKEDGAKYICSGENGENVVQRMFTGVPEETSTKVPAGRKVNFTSEHLNNEQRPKGDTNRFAPLSEDDMEVDDSQESTKVSAPSRPKRGSNKKPTKPKTPDDGNSGNIDDIILEFTDPLASYDSSSETEFDDAPPPPLENEQSDRHSNDTGNNDDPPPPADNEYLIQLNIELSPKMDNISRMIEGVRQFLDGVQRMDPNAQIPARLPSAAKFHPPLKSTKDEKFPDCFVQLGAYIKCGNLWVLEHDPVDANTLKTRLQHAKTPPHQRKVTEQTNGPTGIYVVLKLSTTIPDFTEFVKLLSMDLQRKHKVKATLKPVQCWDSSPKLALIGVNNGFDQLSIQDALAYHLKKVEQYLCIKGKLDLLEYYDLPLPPFQVQRRKLRSMRLPEHERKTLSFNGFSEDAKFAYMIEASESSWARLDPLLTHFVNSNRIVKVFGPCAHLLRIPDNNSDTAEVRQYMRKSRVTMAYNLSTTVYKCHDVQDWDKVVKVKMAECPVLDEDGNETGEIYCPPPPYKTTDLRKELSRLSLNGTRIFHTALLSTAPSDRGSSRVAVKCDPNLPHHKDIQAFAATTLANLAGFFYHWWSKEVGYDMSTIKRLLQSFYPDNALLAPDSVWNSEEKVATSPFAAAADRWLDDFEGLVTGQTTGKDKNLATPVISMTDDTRQELLNRMNYKDNQQCEDAEQSKRSKLTSDDATTCGGSTVRTENTEQFALNAKDYALKLAKEKARSAEQQLELETLRRKQQEEMEKLRAELEQMRNLMPAPPAEHQGSPPLSGSGPSPPAVQQNDTSGQEEPQGS